MLIDTHAHLDDDQFDADRDEVIARSFSGGIKRIINVGAGIGSSRRSVKLAEENEKIFASVGLHPHYFMKHKNFAREYQKELIDLAKNKKTVAIGEIGLDYFFHGENLSDEEKEVCKKKQKGGFSWQLDLAQKLKLPVIIHCREAYADTWEILKNYSQLKIVYHCYGGNLEYTRELLQRENILFSFTGNITYAKEGAEILRVIEKIPLEKIMLETDCPYLAPVPKRGKRNEPIFVKYTGEQIAKIKKMDKEKIEKKTLQNAWDFFGLE